MYYACEGTLVDPADIPTTTEGTTVPTTTTTSQPACPVTRTLHYRTIDLSNYYLITFFTALCEDTNGNRIITFYNPDTQTCFTSRRIWRTTYQALQDCTEWTEGGTFASAQNEAEWELINEKMVPFGTNLRYNFGLQNFFRRVHSGHSNYDRKMRHLNLTGAYSADPGIRLGTIKLTFIN